MQIEGWQPLMQQSMATFAQCSSRPKTLGDSHAHCTVKGAEFG